MRSEAATDPSDDPTHDWFGWFRFGAAVGGLLIPQVAGLPWSHGEPNGPISLLGIAWFWLPYGTLALLSFIVRNKLALVLPLGGFTAFALYGEAALSEATSSTAALGYFAVPLYQLLAALPISVGLGYLVSAIVRVATRRSRDGAAA